MSTVHSFKYIPGLVKDSDIHDGEETHVTISVEADRHKTSGELIVEIMIVVEDDVATAIYLAVRPQDLIDQITQAVLVFTNGAGRIQ